MNIAHLNEKILFQKNEVITDDIGNRKNKYMDYYTCYATVSGENGNEKNVTGLVVYDFDIAFTIRWCKKALNINTTEYRVIFDEEIYNILSIDHMNYKKKCLKFRCKKVRE